MTHQPDNLPPDAERDEVDIEPSDAAPASRHERVLRGTAALPAMFTIGNGVSGFASIYFATKDRLGEATPHNLAVACWMILLAMVFDMLDGRVARMTRRTSDFGGQLDSLCDVISFGVAPAMLMLRVMATALHGQIESVLFWDSDALGRVTFVFAAVYMACATLRLARFNVENDPDESAHMSFRGLPSPGAAAAVAGMVLLFAHISAVGSRADVIASWKTSEWLLTTVSVVLPLVTLACGLLMVSRFTYPHVVNQYMRGRKPFGYIVKLVMIVLAALVLSPYVAAALAAVLYALSGPVGAILRKLRPRPVA